MTGLPSTYGQMAFVDRQRHRRADDRFDGCPKSLEDVGSRRVIFPTGRVNVRAALAAPSTP